MFKVNHAEYPVNQEWDNKVFSMPNIPRGEIGFIEALREILTMVKENVKPNTKLNFDGSSSNISLDEACVRLRPMKLVEKNQSGWVLPLTSIKWLESGDNLYLGAILCANIRFLAEILFYLDTPRTSAELNDIANTEFDMNWKTISAINGRLVWLRELKLVDFQKFSLLYNITSQGKKFINSVKVVDPSEIIRNFDDTIDEETVNISDWAMEYYDKNKSNLRKAAMGYFAGNKSKTRETLSDFLVLIRSGAGYGLITEHAEKKYKIAPSSTKSFMTNLSYLNFIRRKTDTIFEITNLAIDWLQKEEMLDFIICLHTKHLFVLEILNELNIQPLSYKELAIKAKVSYGFEKEKVYEIRKRISILKSAKLVINVSADKYALSKRGKNLLKEFPELIIVKKTVIDNEIAEDAVEIDSLFNELWLASRDSSNPHRFEKVVKSCFEEIGFEAQLFGGAGKTDVLLQAPGASKFSFTVAVDAKSTGSGSITDSLVDFDTLKEHKRKHQADFIAIVGTSFKNERLIKRAIEHNVVLINVDTLEELIKKHKSTPLIVGVYKNIFKQKGVVDISVLNTERNRIIRNGNLMKAVIKCLLNESKDKITEGQLQERDVYRSLRDKEKFSDGIELDEISSMLTFLSSPLIGCLGKEKGYYYAIGSLEDVARKFKFFVRACK